jgi:outer membrane lipoprotein-sorting protein
VSTNVIKDGIPQKAVDGSTSTFYDPSTCSLTEVSTNAKKKEGIPQKAVDGSTSTFYDPSTCSLTEVSTNAKKIWHTAESCKWQHQHIL